MGGRSLLEWNLRWLSIAGFGPIWVNLHYRAEEVRAAVKAMALPGEPVRFSHEDPILGTAGAWRKLADQWDGPSMVVYGDNLTRFDLSAFAAAHIAHNVHEGRGDDVLATVALFDAARHASTGIAGSRVVVDGDGRVTGFIETRGRAVTEASSLVSTGACLLEPEVAERIGPGFADFGTDVFPSLVADRVLAAHLIEEGGYCLGLDTPSHFETGRHMVESGRVPLIPTHDTHSPS